MSNRSMFQSAVSGDFNLPATWGGTAPGTNAGVIIGTNHTVTLHHDEVIGSIVEIQNGAMDLNGFTLTLNAGRISTPGTGQLLNGGGTIAFAPSLSGFVIPTDFAYNDLRIQGSGTTQISGTLNVSGDLQIDPGATLDLNGSHYQINVEGNNHRHPFCLIKERSMGKTLNIID